MLAFHGIGVAPYGVRPGVSRRNRLVRHCTVRVDPPPDDKLRRLGSVSVVRDEKSGVDVYVVGCIHGFRSSVRDVETVAASVTSPIRAVMIELCEDRWRVISKLKKDKRSSKLRKESFNLFSLLRAPARFGGSGPALVGSVLVGISNLQKLSGFEPGLEFVCAADEAKRLGAKLVLGDRPANDTIQRLSKALNPLQVFTSPLQTLKLLLPDLPPRNGVNLVSTFLDVERMREMFVLTFPTTLLSFVAVQGMGFVGDALFPVHALMIENVEILSTSTIEDAFYYTLLGLVISAIASFLKVVIHERDVYLYESLEKILDDASVVDKREELTAIIGVCGLLHVNGIVRLLNERNAKFSEASASS
ncbi:hypothetical protein NDN08_005778 [Rhodosorus marinus]|uniref:Uncharacterized protein n=1 Tax=Rhodosorus marinus TaxID=101924 RepID=A0AAV8V2K0_9RHOD|nr:hypothetical protein NDN08_005778 [Rhodosorus marinus]